MLEVLSTEDLERIDRASMALLERMGVRLDDDALRQRMIAAGARRAPEADAVLLPEAMVREKLRLCPSVLPLANLAGEASALRPVSPSRFWTANAMHLVSGGDRREMRAGDLADLARLADALANVHAVVGTSMADVPPAARDFVGFRLMAERTRKHLRPCMYTPAGVEAIIEMAEMLLDGAALRDLPIFSLGFTAVTPLRWSATALGIFARSSGRGIPMMVNGEPTAGTTGPVTLAGAIALAHAEVLSGIAVLQTLEPGRPCVHNIGFAHVADMRSALAMCGAPENGLIAAAGAQLARRYELPSASWVSSDGSICDGQSAHESTLGFLLHALAGVNLIWGIGSLESELSLCFEKAVLDDECAGAVRRAVRGVEVEDSTLALEETLEVGRDGDFLGHAHTLEHFRRALWQPLVHKRGRRESWEAQGARPVERAAREKVAEILSRPARQLLSDEQLRRLGEIEQKWLRRVA